MARRTGWILGGVLGVLVVTAGGLVIALKVSAPPQAVAAVKEKALPAAWTVPEGTPSQSPSPDEPASGVAAALGQGFPDTSQPTVHETGSMVFTGDGRRFGEETYELSVGPDGARLTSSGVFEVRVLLVTIRARFSQSLAADVLFRPRTYTLHLDAPLGFGRDIRGEIAPDGSVVGTGQDGAGERVDPDRAFVLGTFSTYALLPLAFKAREREGGASFDVLTFFGPADDHAGAGRAADPGASSVTVERLDEATIRAGRETLTVERYRIRGGEGDSFLLARDGEFLAFLAGDDKHTLFVYRSDRFPAGFEVLP